MSEQPKKYILYARKSTEDKSKQVQSIEGQLRIMKRDASTKGYYVTKVITEAKSAKTPGARPGYREMIRLIEADEADGIICWHINRLARNVKEGGEIHQLLIDRKIKKIVTHEKDFNSEDNALLMSIEGGVSTQYSRDLVHMVTRGMQQKVEKGWLPRRPPVGYMNDRENKIIINDPERFELMKKAWEMLLSGNYTVNHIARIAGEEWGLTIKPGRTIGGKPITDTHMHRLFKNVFYAGVILHNGAEYRGNHEPIITREQFELAQTLISRKTAYRTQKENKIDHFHYRGLLSCGECGCAITFTRKVRKYSTRSVTYEYCHCTRRRKSLNCSQRKPVTQAELSRLLKEEVSKYEIGEEFFKWACRHIEEAAADEDKKWLSVLIAKERRLEELKTHLNNLQGALVRNQIDDEYYQLERKRMKTEIQTQEKSISIYEETRGRWREEAKKLFGVGYYVNNLFEKDDPKKRKEVIRKIGRNIQLTDGKLLLNPNPGLIPIKNMNETSDILKISVGTPPLQRKNAPLGDVESIWYTRQDSNLWPSAPQADALSS